MKGAWKYERPQLSALRRYPKGKKLDAVEYTAKRAAELAAELEDDMNLSDQGRRKNFTNSVLPRFVDIAEREQELRKERKAVQRDRKKRWQDQQPDMPTAAEMTHFLALVQMSRESDQNRDFFWKVMRKDDAQGIDLRMQMALLTVSPAIFGAVGFETAEKYQEIMRRRLGVDDLGQEGEKLDQAELEIDAELKDIRELRISLVRAGDRDQLVNMGLAMKPVTQWTNEEKRNYLHEHGQAALAQVFEDEREYSLAVRAERRRDTIFEEMGEDETAEDFARRLLETDKMRADREAKEAQAAMADVLSGREIIIPIVANVA